MIAFVCFVVGIVFGCLLEHLMGDFFTHPLVALMMSIFATAGVFSILGSFGFFVWWLCHHVVIQ